RASSAKTYFELSKRKTVKELPGNLCFKLVPVNDNDAVRGDTLVGSSNEFSSVPLLEERTVAATALPRLVIPRRSSCVSMGLLFTLTTFTMRLPERCSLS